MSARTAAAAYFAGSVIFTWPLALGLSSDVPGDLGDSLLNMWILAWGAEHIPRVLAGATSWQAFWNANIFHPDPLALTFSEHLFGQALQILPVYWTTGNIILCYNLLFITTFALSGFGAYLLVRDLTGDRRAAFAAGVVYGFLPYRIASIPHLQVMSAQWMPFALYGFNRFVTTGSRRALAGGTAALVMQNWSCGYYLLYFAPFVPLFVLHRLWGAGKLRDLRVWLSLSGAAVATLALTLPFLLPYLEAQRLYGFERPYAEVVQYSANVWSYVTAPESLRVWGEALRAYPRAEGETFLGFVPWLLALVALVAGEKGTGIFFLTSEGKKDPRPLFSLLAIAVIIQAAMLLNAVITGGFEWHVLGITIRARTLPRLLLQVSATFAILLAVSPRARAAAARLVRSPVAVLAACTLMAVWLSLGPSPASGAQQLSGFGLYNVLYEYVPGFNGVRVPARYAMIAGLFLAALAGHGAAALLRWRVGPALVAVATVLALAEGAAVPLALNLAWAQNEAMPPARVFPASQAPPVYARVKALPRGSVITEFPFGDAAWEIRYVYYAAVHWKPLTNGYSGSFPQGYTARVARLQRVTADPDNAWQALVDSGSTHVVVHDQAFANPADAVALRQWLLARGAAIVDSFPGGDTLYNLRPQMRM